MKLRDKIKMCMMLLCILFCVNICTGTSLASGLGRGQIMQETTNATITESGTCGDNLTWTLDSDGKLTISGTGDMYNYKGYSSPFAESDNIKSVYIEQGVTSIGGSAFFECHSLTSISIPDSVTSIGDYAFYYCSSLISISIPDSVTSIGNYAFEYCSNLTSISIPDSVTSIGNYAFEGCSSLTSISIPDSVTSIGDGAFYDCSSLTSISIPDSVPSIGNYTFCDCSSLTSISIPDSVISIGYVAFSSCSSLTSISIPDSVTSIGFDAFYDCSNLTSINIPDSVTSIGYGAFEGCSSLTSISIPDSVPSIGNYTFYYCSSLTSISIPDSVTSIGDYAFYYCSSLTSISIPDSVTSIGDGAFEDCSNLISISIPDSVTSIEDETFSGCRSLTSISIPERVTSIGDKTFSGCRSLTSISIPDSVTSIGRQAFYGCSRLISISIPDSVTTIREEVFYGCNKLTLTVFPGSNAEKYAIENNIPYIYFTIDTPVLSKVENTSAGQKITWQSVKNAKSYNVYRKNGTSGWKKIGTSTSSSYTDKTVSSGVTYTYTVRAVYGEAISGYDKTGRSLLYLAMPALSSVSNVNGGQTIKWTKSTGAAGYYVYRKTSGASWSRVATISNADTVSYTDKTGSSGTTYIYTVKAYNGSVNSAYDSTGKSLKYLAMPALSSVSNVNGGQTIKWTKSSGASGYYVYRKVSGASCWTRITTISSADTVSYTDKTVSSGTTYIYTVKAYNGSVNSAYDSTGKSLKYLATPTLGSLSNVNGGQTIKWGKVTGATGYYVYRKTSGTGWARIATITSGSTVAYTDKTVEGGKTYIYTVRAYNGSVLSSYNSIGKTLLYLTMPTISVKKVSTGISVTWTKTTGAAGYYVYRKTSDTSWARITTVTSGSTVSYVDKTAKSGTNYYYTVRAYNGLVTSTYKSSAAIKR